MVWRCSSVGSGQVSTFAVTWAISASLRSIARSAAVWGWSPGRGCAIAASRARRALVWVVPGAGLVGGVVSGWLGWSLRCWGVVVCGVAVPVRVGVVPGGVVGVVGVA
jgi:hypothetical protein